MRELLLYLLYRTAVALITAIPADALFRLGNVIGFCAWLILPHYRRLALHNVSIAFGGTQTRRELKRLVRRHFQRLGANLLCGVKVAVMPLEELERRVQTENFDAIERHLRAKRGVVVILSHLGNWELMSQFVPRVFGHVRNSTIYQKLANRLIDEHVRKLRARVGVEMFDRKEGFHKAIELLRGGGVIGILSDQHAGDQGLWTPFFGKLASTTPLPALLAKRTGAALVSMAVYTQGAARWRIAVESSLDPTCESIESLTSKSNEIIARQIRGAPEDWFWVHNRWKTPRPNFLLSRYKRGSYLPPGTSPNEVKSFRILIRSSNWLGDAVMSVPAVRAIKHGRPDAHVTLLAPANLVAVWKLIPEVDNVIALESKSLLRAVRLINKSGPFDVGILFPNSLRTALELWLADVPRRVGYRGHARAWLVNQIVRERRKPRPPEHQSRRYLRMAYELGAKIASVQLSPIRSQRTNGDAATTNGKTRIALCPGAEYGPAKRWLPERFIETASTISNQQTVEWILFGTGRDAVVGEQIAKALGETCVNRIGKTTLDQLIEELRECRFLLTNDTGTMHLAALLGIPVVAVFGSTEPALTGPIGREHIVLRHHVECSPCFLRECPIDFRCMTSVTVDEVRAVALSILRKTDGATGTDRTPTPKPN